MPPRLQGTLSGVPLEQSLPGGEGQGGERRKRQWREGKEEDKHGGKGEEAAEAQALLAQVSENDHREFVNSRCRMYYECLHACGGLRLPPAPLPPPRPPINTPFPFPPPKHTQPRPSPKCALCSPRTSAPATSAPAAVGSPPWKYLGP